MFYELKWICFEFLQSILKDSRNAIGAQVKLLVNVKV